MREIPRHRKCPRHELGEPLGECDAFCLTWRDVTTGSLPVVTEPLDGDPTRVLPPALGKFAWLYDEGGEEPL